MKQSTIFKLICSLAIGLFYSHSQAQTNLAPLATVTASTCYTGSCSTLNDLNLGTCGTQSMWIRTSSPPSTTPGVNWIEWNWTTPQTFDEIVIHHANGPVTSGRNLAGFLAQYWSGSAWVSIQTISGLPRACINNVKINVTTASRFRITSFTMFPQGQLSNPNFREIEILQAILIPDNAATLSVDSPSVFCEGTHNVVARIGNRGINQIDSVRVNWTFNGVTQPTYFHKSVLDTLNGTGANEAQVILGSKFFTSGVMDSIAVWTSMPNGVSDTFNIDDTAIVLVQPAIFGNFTIDPNGSGVNNYTTWGGIAKDLSDFGVCGPVNVLVSPGVYTEQVSFDEILGASSMNTITFTPDTGGVVSVEYSSSSSANNFTIKLDKADYISFSDMTFKASGSTYSRVFEINNGASNNSFSNCIFDGYATASTWDWSGNQVIIYTRSAGNDYNSFTNSEFNGGSYGVDFRGGGFSSTNVGNEFIGNSFINQVSRGMYFQYNTDLKINQNIMRSNTTYTSFYGIYSYYGFDNCEIIGNDINIPGYTGIYCYQYNGTQTDKPLIANNFVRVGRMYGSRGYGIYFNGGYARIIHNTIVTTQSSSGANGALYISGGVNTILNNNIHDQTGNTSTWYGSLYYSGGFSILESDYNNVYTNRNFGQFSGGHATLTDWQTATGFDEHSLTSDPGFVNFDSLRTCSDTLDGAGTPVSYVTDDFDGDGRNPVTPDIGADEWIGNDSNAYSAGPDAIVCAGKTAIIGLGVSGGSFSWSTGDTTSTIEVSTQGTYTVTMTSICGSSFTDTVEVSDITPIAGFTINNSFLTGDFTNISSFDNSRMWIVGVIPPDTSYGKDLIYVFPNNGPFDVTLYIYNDCDTAEVTHTWMGTVGVEENDLSNMISLMPNPVSDILTIQFEGIDGDVTVEMSNIQGQLVHTDRYLNIAGNSNKTIDVSGLRKGMYIVKFITDKGVTTKQIIVQ